MIFEFRIQKYVICHENIEHAYVTKNTGCCYNPLFYKLLRHYTEWLKRAGINIVYFNN